MCGNYLAVQGLGSTLLTAEGPGSIPGELRSHKTPCPAPNKNRCDSEIYWPIARIIETICLNNDFQTSFFFAWKLLVFATL